MWSAIPCGPERCAARGARAAEENRAEVNVRPQWHLEEEFAKFVADAKPEEAAAIPAIRTYFKAYVTSGRAYATSSRAGTTQDLATNPFFNNRDFKAVPKKYRTLIPDYVKDYVTLNQFIT